MKILIVHSELGVLRGGGENFTRNLFAAFADRGHKVAAVFASNRLGKYSIPLPAAIQPIPIPGWWSRKLGQGTFSTIRRYLPVADRFRLKLDRIQDAICWRTIRWHERRFQERVRREMADRWDEFDAVYVHGDPILAEQVAQSRPTILRLPGPVAPDLGPILRTIHAVCANGDAIRHIRSFLGDHAIELPIGLDERIFTPGPTSIRSRLGWSDHNVVVGYVGRLTHIKGVDLLATAFGEISQILANARLLVIGSGEEERNLRHILGKEIACGLVHIESDVVHAQLPQWYRVMDLLVMPSRYENFSNAVLEAMSCGVPVLASDIGGNKITANEGGWLFSTGSVTSLSQCLGEILKNVSDLKLRGDIAARSVRGGYSWAASAECLEQMIRSRLGVHE